ncbi:hypothetical protein MOU90_004976, partial [Vibrio parahaemolyticus]|nr:hypothetical protein [Vibrio parahaemolyticus]
MSENLELPNVKEVIDLRIEVYFCKKGSSEKPIGKRIKPVQGDSVDIYIKVTNISDKIFQGAKVNEFKFEHRTNHISTLINKGVQLRTLNAGESYEQKVDWTTFKFDGVYWVCLKLEPSSENQELLTYQHDPSHNQDEKYEINDWGDTIYLEGKLATLQTRTNNYILLLTVITVWEAIFGIKNTLKFLLTSLSFVLGALSSGVEYILS